MDAIYQFILDYGSGNVTADLALTALGLAIIVQALFLSALSRKLAELQDIAQKWERSSQGGKIQKLEDALSEFRTEVMRALAGLESRAELEEKKTEELKDLAVKNLEVEKVVEAALQPEEAIEPEEAFKTEEIGKLEEITEIAPVEKVPAEEAVVAVAVEPLAVKPKVGVFQGLSRTRNALLEKIKSVFIGETKLSDENIEELEAQLIGADLGVTLSEKLLSELKVEIKSGKLIEQSEFLNTLKNKVETILVNGGAAVREVKPEKTADKVLVVMMVGVNGAGKTTTSAKLAHRMKQEGFSPLLVAADTFRAAAVDQLKVWGERIDVPVVCGAENAKPSTVVFDAMTRVKQGGIDAVIIDTAGRLQNKTNLMQELSGISNAISRHIEGAPQEIILVVDGSSGQNAISQAREFQQATGLTGVIVTKLDGTPKGGSVVAIKSELGIPVRYIGIGEGLDDLQVFNAREFSEALLGE